MRTTKEMLQGLRQSGLSQSEIARRTGIRQPRLSRWESGETPAGADDALKLQQLYAELIGTEGPAAVLPVTQAADKVRDAA